MAGSDRQERISMIDKTFANPAPALADVRDDAAVLIGGQLDSCVPGTFQFSRGGDRAHGHAGAAGAVPALGGAIDLAVGARHTCAMMEHATRSGQPKIVAPCTAPLTAVPPGR
jgi:3-oxoadipate CoA-transferase beta subunit